MSLKMTHGKGFLTWHSFQGADMVEGDTCCKVAMSSDDVENAN